MVQKCPAKYKNLNHIQSFSEQGYATIQLMQQACMNDEWLRQRVLQLNYLSAPAVRKWYQNGEWINPKLSYGYSTDINGNIVFDNTIEQIITVDFVDDEDKIDMDKSDVIFMSQDGGETEQTVEEDGGVIRITTTDEDAENCFTRLGSRITLDGSGDIITDTIDDVDPNVSINHWCQLPFENEVEKYTITNTQEIQGQKAVYDSSTKTITSSQTNSAWYVGFNKSENYYVRPDWLKDWRDKEIPSVCRGQTFKANATGKLESIDLRLDYNGTLSSDCGSPLYVQIWKTKKENRKKTTWNNKTKKMEYVYKKHSNNTGGDYNKVNGVYKKVASGTGAYSLVYEKVPVPDTTNTGIYKPLAQAEYNPSKMTSFGDVNIKFDKECKLVKGNSYFIALFSPLSEWKHCPRWGGWGRNCKRDKKYEYGNAFLSENNGRTWIRFGRNDASVDYKQGKYVPQDFAFKCHIRTKDKIDASTNTTITLEEGVIDDANSDNPRYLYLKPIRCNPLTSIRIEANSIGSGANSLSNDGIGITYEYKVKDHDWKQIPLAVTEYFDTTDFNDEELPETVLVRAKLYRDTTTVDPINQNLKRYRFATPKIYSLTVILTTELPRKMYVRTFEWQPRTDAMLGARIWGRIYAPFETDPTVTCQAEIVTNEQPTDHFTLLSVGDVYSYCESKIDGYDLENPNYTSEMKTLLLDEDYSRNTEEDTLCDYIYANSNLITELKNNKAYVKPYTKGDYLYRMSFTPSNENDMRVSSSSDYHLGGFQLTNEVAYPILECIYTPENSTSEVVTYGEESDYTFDYENNILKFGEGIIDNLPLGDIAVSYNKCFIRNLTDTEVGVHTNSETGLKEEGLILDYFKEQFNIDDANVETRRVKLRVEPVDPIREVVLNRDTDNEIELYEGFDYVLDSDTNELVFNIANIDGVSSILKSGDVLDVVYTPNLQATALSIGYWCTRTNTDKQVRIKNSYWEYKA